MKKGLFVISTPKWKVREYVRIIIGAIMVVAFLAFFTYLGLKGEYLKMTFLNWLFK